MRAFILPRSINRPERDDMATMCSDAKSVCELEQWFAWRILDGAFSINEVDDLFDANCWPRPRWQV